MKKLFGVISIFILCLILGELSLQVMYFFIKGRWHFDAYRFTAGRCTVIADPDIGYVNAPNLYIKRPGAKEGIPNAPRHKNFYDVTTDSHGFRYEGDLDSPRAPGEVRVFCLGGSTTYGAEVPNRWTYPQQLNDLFGDPKVKVVNAGAGGYRSIHLLRYYEKYIRPFLPDIITIYCGWNDYEDYLFSYWKSKDPLGHALVSQFDEYINSPIKSLIVGRLLLRSYYKLMNYNRGDTASEWLRSKYYKEADNPVWLEEHRSNLQQLIDEARKDSCLPVLINFPSPEFPNAPQEAKDFSDIDLNMSGRWDAMVTALQGVRKNLFELAQKNQVPFIDVNSAFDRYNQDYKAKFKMFIDKMHLTKEGNTLIARTMYPEMKVLIEQVKGKKRLNGQPDR